MKSIGLAIAITCMTQLSCQDRPLCYWGCQEAEPLYCGGDNECEAGMEICNIDENMALVNACLLRCDVEGGPTCLATAPICNNEGRCSSCTADEEVDAACVALDGDTPYCAGGECVQCIASGDCVDPTQPICDANACVACDAVANDQCPVDTMCNPADGRCVECMQDEDCAGDEVCSQYVDSGTCVAACSAHGDCVSDACDLRTGQCLLADDVVYVDGINGDDSNTECAGGAPCQTIAAGLTAAAARSVEFMVLADTTYTSAVEVTGGQSIIMIGPATIDVSGSPVLQVNGGSSAALQSMTLTNGTDGVVCTGASTIDLWKNTVSGSDGLGVSSTNCTTNIERSRILGNLGGGIAITDSSFTVINNYILGNGKGTLQGSAVGGVSINNAVDAERQIFVFNTVANNIIATGSSTKEGMHCSVPSMTIWNSIVYLNATNSPVSGNCAWGHSNVEGGVPGTGNIEVDPMFEDLAANDAALTAASPHSNANPDVPVPAGVNIGIDIDGNPRPATPDMGAHEFPNP